MLTYFDNSTLSKPTINYQVLKCEVFKWVTKRLKIQDPDRVNRIDASQGSGGGFEDADDV